VYLGWERGWCTGREAAMSINKEFNAPALGFCLYLMRVGWVDTASLARLLKGEVKGVFYFWDRCRGQEPNETMIKEGGG
jgi:hypothetical protein